MTTRYEDVTSDVSEMVDRIKDQKFPELDGSIIMPVFDLKKKTTAGKLIFARIKKTNDEMKFLAMDDMGIAPDFIIFIDKTVWMVLDDRDKERIIYHELCHTNVNPEKENMYTVREHEIQGFHSEFEYNADDPRWLDRISVVAEAVYDPENVEAPQEEV